MTPQYFARRPFGSNDPRVQIDIYESHLVIPKVLATTYDSDAAKRIVACLNACLGMSDEYLTKYSGMATLLSLLEHEGQHWVTISEALRLAGNQSLADLCKRRSVSLINCWKEAKGLPIDPADEAFVKGGA